MLEYGKKLYERAENIASEIRILIDSPQFKDMDSPTIAKEPRFHTALFLALLTQDGDPIVLSSTCASFAQAFEGESKIDENVVTFDVLKHRFQKYVNAIKAFEELSNPIANTQMRFAAIAAAYLSDDPARVVQHIERDPAFWQSAQPIPEVLKKLSTVTDKNRLEYAVGHASVFHTLEQSEVPLDKENVLDSLKPFYNQAYYQYDNAKKNHPELNVALILQPGTQGAQLNTELGSRLLNAMKYPPENIRAVNPDANSDMLQFNAHLDKMIAGLQTNDPRTVAHLRIMMDYFQRKDGAQKQEKASGAHAREKYTDADNSILGQVLDVFKMPFDSSVPDDVRIGAGLLAVGGIMTLLGKGPAKKFRNPLIALGVYLGADKFIEYQTGRGISARLGIEDLLREFTQEEGSPSRVYRQAFLDKHALGYGQNEFILTQLDNVSATDFLAWRDILHKDRSAASKASWMPDGTPNTIRRLQNRLMSQYTHLSKEDAGEMINKIAEAFFVDVATSHDGTVSEASNKTRLVLRGEQLLRDNLPFLNPQTKDATMNDAFKFFIAAEITEEKILVDVARWVKGASEVVPQWIREKYEGKEEEIRAALELAQKKGGEYWDAAVKAISEGYADVRQKGFDGIFKEIKDYKIDENGRTLNQVWNDEVKPHLDNEVMPALSRAGQILWYLWKAPFEILLWGMGVFGKAEIPVWLKENFKELRAMATDVVTENAPDFIFEADEIRQGTPELWWNDDYFGQFAPEVTEAFKAGQPFERDGAYFLIGSQVMQLTPEEADQENNLRSENAKFKLFKDKAAKSAFDNLPLTLGITDAGKKEEAKARYELAPFKYSQDGENYAAVAYRIPTPQQIENEGIKKADDAKSFEHFLDDRIDRFLEQGDFKAVLNKIEFPNKYFLEAASAILKSMTGINIPATIKGEDAFRYAARERFFRYHSKAERLEFMQHQRAEDLNESPPNDKDLDHDLLRVYANIAYPTYLNMEMEKFLTAGNRRAELQKITISIEYWQELVNQITKLAQGNYTLNLVFKYELFQFYNERNGLDEFYIKVMQKMIMEKSPEDRLKLIQSQISGATAAQGDFQQELLDIFTEVKHNR